MSEHKRETTTDSIGEAIGRLKEMRNTNRELNDAMGQYEDIEISIEATYVIEE